MAEIQSLEKINRKKKGMFATRSTKTDLTPMVDLGFLLISFFIFTTTQTEAKVLGLILPSDKPVEDSSKAPESKTITLVLDEKNTIYYYTGLDLRQGAITNYSATGIRTVLQKKTGQVNKQTGKKGETIVLIKPKEKASYQNIVDILDEMRIHDIKKYVLMDINKEEADLFPVH